MWYVLRRMFYFLKAWCMKMRFPSISASRNSELRIPEFDGGLNQNNPENIEPNQLSDCKNVYYKNGKLVSRKGMVKDSTLLSENDITGSASFSTDNSLFFLAGVLSASGTAGDPDRVVGKVLVKKSNGKLVEQTLYYSFSGDEENFPPSEITPIISSGKNGVVAYLIFKDCKNLFKIVRNGLGDDRSYSISKVFESEITVPTIAVNLPGNKAGMNSKGTFFEGYNLLTEFFYIYFNADGESDSFFFPDSDVIIKNLGDFEVEYTSPKGQICKWYISPADNQSTGTVKIDGLDTGGAGVYCKVATGNKYLRFFYGQNTPVALQNPGFSSSIKVKARCGRKKEYSVTQMSLSEWYGGDASGIQGGTRVFLAGSDSEKNIIIWSDTNDPLYFPENNYAFIGSSEHKITALKKQYSKLIIFKDNEIFAATYQAGTRISAEEVMNYNLLDVTANAAKFPITPVSSSIGCERGTAQLCDNNLVWAFNGSVYTLLGTNIYNESNAVKVSDNLNRIPFSSKYNSCESEGYYFLFGKRNAFLMNTETQAFYKNKMWFVFDLLENEQGMILEAASFDNTIYFLMYKNINSATGFSYDIYHMQGTVDQKYGESDIVSDYPIETMIKTKSFNFGRPELYKTISHIYVQLEMENQRMLTTYFTEGGEYEDANDGVINGLALRTPNSTRVRTLSVKLEAEAPASFSNVAIKYKFLGGVR